MNETLKKIVVGTDFNELATAAVRFAASIAGKTGSELLLVYADTFEPPAEFTTSQVKRIVDSIERSKVKTREQLEKYAARHVSPAVRARIIVAEGAPAGAILRVAAEEDAGMIALGTHGRGALQRLMMGSVAESVIREATVPVLTLTTAAESRPVARILCLVNGGAASVAAAMSAAALADDVGARLTLLRSHDAGPFDPAALGDVETLAIGKESHPAEAILEAADSGRYDLLVIGAEHRFLSDVTAFGTAAASVIRHSTIPVLTVGHRQASA